MTISDITWIFAVIGIAGALLNAGQKRSGFILWSISNTGLILINLAWEDLAQATLFGVYLAVCIWGWCRWK